MSRISEDSFSILNMTKGKLPRLPFADIKDAVLGKKYILSLVFVGNAKSKKLNSAYRGKNKPTNVLSFTISPAEGEIFINPHIARKQMKEFDRSYSSMIGFLLIHGLLHLKGFDHSSKMESKEQKFCKQFNF